MSRRVTFNLSWQRYSTGPTIKVYSVENVNISNTEKYHSNDSISIKKISISEASAKQEPRKERDLSPWTGAPALFVGELDW
jgi:phage-related protein